MKRRMVSLVLLALLGGVVAPTTVSAQVRVSFGAFYSSLSPHGEWMTVHDGVYAWRPARVVEGWRPYLRGRWVWSDDGWYWASDEPWGWATYHYGRWYYDDFYGWVWIPGYEWAPAWVEWRYGGDYVGWAPLGPYAVFHASVGIYYTRHWVTPYRYWSFVGCRDIGRDDMSRYVFRHDDNARLFGRTRSAGNVGTSEGRIVTRGPDRLYVEQRGGVRVPRTDFIDVRTPGEAGIRSGEGRDQIHVYRPQVDRQLVDRPEHPERVEGNRPIGLDPRGLDVRRKGMGDDALGGRTDPEQIWNRSRERRDPEREPAQVAPDRLASPQGDRRPPPSIERRNRDAERRFERREEYRLPERRGGVPSLRPDRKSEERGEVRRPPPAERRGEGRRRDGGR